MMKEHRFRTDLRSCAQALLIAAVVTGCGPNPNEVALEIGMPLGTEEGLSTVEWRAIQTRRFEIQDDVKILDEATQTLQDLGFTVVESSVAAGLLVASKKRDAKESGQVAKSVTLMLLLALLGSYTSPMWDEEQEIFVTLIVSPVDNVDEKEVRVLFDRRIKNNEGVLWRAELIEDAEIYQNFFDKLSHSLFVDASET